MIIEIQADECDWRTIRYGAAGVWVGTRFVACVEAGAPKRHKDLVVSAGYDDTVRTLIYSGRPLQVRKTDYVKDWEENRQDEIRALTSQGKLPHDEELAKHPEKSVQGIACEFYPTQNILNVTLLPSLISFRN